MRRGRLVSHLHILSHLRWMVDESGEISRAAYLATEQTFDNDSVAGDEDVDGPD